MRTSAQPGDSGPMTLYWKALAPMKVNLRVFIHLIGPDGKVVKVWPKVDVQKHSEEVLAEIAANKK